MIMKRFGNPTQQSGLPFQIAKPAIVTRVMVDAETMVPKETAEVEI